MVGATGHGRGWGRCCQGRDKAGRVARSPPPPSSSSSEDGCRHVHNFKFIAHITADPFGRKKLPDKFAEFLDGREPADVYPREASCGVCRWTVEAWFDGEGKMFLTSGSAEFAREHSVEVGFLVHIYESDENMIVKVFDDESCRVHYLGDDSGDGSDVGEDGE